MHAQAHFTAQRVVRAAAVQATHASSQSTKLCIPASRLAQPHRSATRQHQLRGGRRQCVAASAAAAPAASEEVSVSEEQLDACRRRLHITVPAGRCQQAWKAVMADLRKNVKVAGYRPGKAPDAAIIAEVGGPQRVANTTMSGLLERALAAAMAPYEDRLVPDSEAIEQGAEELEKLFNLEKGFTFTVRFDAVPELKWKAPYRDLAVAVESAGDASTDAARVEQRLQEARKRNARLSVAVDRGLRPGDLAIIDFTLHRADTGEEIMGAGRQSMRLDTDDADETFLPGIVAKLDGMKPGEQRDVAMTLPTDEKFQPAALRGQEVVVKVKMAELFEYDLPEMDDEWAASVLPGSDMAGLRAQMLQAAAAQREAEQLERIADALQAAVGRAVEVEVPESLLAELGSQQYSVELNRLLSQGTINFETVQQMATPELAEQFTKSRREELLELQRALLGFDDIARREELQPREEEIQEELKQAAAEFQQYGQEYDEERLREQVTETVQANKVMDWLIANCRVNVLAPGQA